MIITIDSRTFLVNSISNQIDFQEIDPTGKTVLKMYFSELQYNRFSNITIPESVKQNSL